ncbi:MAG: carboxypeptidase regulatory-like domain-containing protein, partial [Pyrinomonadaceae bacterium]
SGTVIATIVDNAAVNAMNVGSTASTSTDNTVTFFTCNNVSIPTNLTALSSTQFLAPINVDDTTGRGILSYDFTLTYNPAVVTPVQVETAGTLSGGWTITTNGSSGTLVVSGFNIAPLSGSGTLLNVRFVASGGIGTSSNLNLPGFAFNEGIPCVNVSNGLVTIISGTVSGKITYANAPVTTPVSNTTVNAAGSIPLSTMTDANGDYSLSGFGAGAYTITPSKTNQINGISNLDATTVAQHVVGFIALNTTQQIAADVTGNGTITSLDAAYIAQFVVNISNPGVTGIWRFIPPNRVYPNVMANSTAQDYSAILMGEVTGNWNPAGPLRLAKGTVKNQFNQVDPIKQNDNLTPVVTVNAPLNQFAATGSNFTVSLTASDTTNAGGPPAETIFGYQFDLLYNSTVIVPQLTPCEVTGTISSSQGFFCNTNTPGLIKVVVFGTGAINGAGTLFKFKFNAIGAPGTFTTLTIQDFMFNEGVPMDITTNGLVTVVGPSAAAISVGGQLLTSTGEPVSKAKVFLTATNGAVRTATSNAFGYYRFDNVSIGETYIVSVSSKRYTFTPMAISPTDSLNELNLIALP